MTEPTSRPMQPDDLTRLRFLSEPQCSPDGSQVAFVVTTLSEEQRRLPLQHLARGHGRGRTAALYRRSQAGHGAALVAGWDKTGLPVRSRSKKGRPVIRDARQRRRAGAAHRPQAGRVRSGLGARRRPGWPSCPASVVGKNRRRRRRNASPSRRASSRTMSYRVQRRRLRLRPATAHLHHPGGRRRAPPDHRWRLCRQRSSWSPDAAGSPSLPPATTSATTTTPATSCSSPPTAASRAG